MRIATFNINGIRAAQRRGFGTWLERRGCDVVALQEVRCRVADLPPKAFGDHHLSYDAGTIPGRNGVAILTRQPPAAVRCWDKAVLLRAPGEEHTELVAPDPLGPLSRELRAFAAQGRYIEVDLDDAPLTIGSLYLPKGGLPTELQVPGRMREAPDGGAKHLRKLAFLAGFAKQLDRSRRAALAAGREFVLMGDFNIAHGPQDVVNHRRQSRSEGFLPVERDWLDSVIGPRRLVDVVRTLRPDEQGPYSWWSWLGQAFENDSGWRIDMQLATPRLARTATTGGTDRDPSRDQRISDHAPVVIDYDLEQLSKS